MSSTNVIRVAIAGLGNCGSSLVQLIHGSIPSEISGDRYSGVYWPNSGPSADESFKVVAAFDVDHEKVGRDLSSAITAPTNCTPMLRAVPTTGVEVLRGPTLDGIEGPLSEVIVQSEHQPVDVVSALKDAKADILVNMLPSGAKDATEHYAEAALAAGCGFVNCIPVRIATSGDWAQRFSRAGLPLLGDDIKSQLGTTSIHQALVDLIQEKGGKIVRTYQMNIGGNADFKNMTQGVRRAGKNISKTSAVQRHVTGLVIPDIGPNGFVQPLGDNKRAHVMIGAELSLGMQVEINLNLSVIDSPNAAGIILPAALECSRAQRLGLRGVLPELSAKLFKMPPTTEKPKE